MSRRKMRKVLVLLALVLLLVPAATTIAQDDLTPEQVAATEREYTYTTPEDVAAGRLAAERYWLYAHTIYEIVAIFFLSPFPS